MVNVSQVKHDALNIPFRIIQLKFSNFIQISKKKVNMHKPFLWIIIYLHRKLRTIRVLQSKKEKKLCLVKVTFFSFW